MESTQHDCGTLRLSPRSIPDEAHIRQPRPDSGFGLMKLFKTVSRVLFSIGSGSLVRADPLRLLSERRVTSGMMAAVVVEVWAWSTAADR